MKVKNWFFRDFPTNRLFVLLLRLLNNSPMSRGSSSCSWLYLLLIFFFFFVVVGRLHYHVRRSDNKIAFDRGKRKPVARHHSCCSTTTAHSFPYHPPLWWVRQKLNFTAPDPILSTRLIEPFTYSANKIKCDDHYEHHHRHLQHWRLFQSPLLSLSSKKRPWLEGGRSVGHLVPVEDPQGKSARSVNHGSFDFMIIVISSIIMCARSLFRASSLPVPHVRMIPITFNVHQLLLSLIQVDDETLQFSLISLFRAALDGAISWCTVVVAKQRFCSAAVKVAFVFRRTQWIYTFWVA